MRYLLILLSLFGCLSLNGQEQIKIELVGFPAKHELQLHLADTVVEIGKRGNILFEKTTKIEGPIFGFVDTETGEYSGFWIEPGATHVKVFAENYPRNTVVEGSGSHDIYLGLKFAESTAAFVKSFSKQPNHITALTYLNRGYWVHEFSWTQLAQMYEMVADENKAQLEDLKAYLNTIDIPRVIRGSNIYNFEGFDAVGTSYATKDYRGQYLLLEFNYGNCEGCIRDLKKLAKTQKKNKNLQVITYNMDAHSPQWLELIEKKKVKITWPVLWTGENKLELFHIYDIFEFPSYFLVNPEGKVIKTWQGSGDPFLEGGLTRIQIR